ncbi:MFS transporter [Actinomadura spongiicola]|uniref:MFS transporter n=1 Tax=Actinomadura spongiicola TaxID=2303421 RepID=A0A372GMJ4_9ACTN|nr:MFS transporter [Actinomadura spongiicola]RFS86608.1 MFS transporter [Actinomadura spongiicola]
MVDRVTDSSGSPPLKVTAPGEAEPPDGSLQYDPAELITVGRTTLTRARYLRRLLLIIYAAYFLASFDGAVAGAAGPTMTRVFDVSAKTLLYSTAAIGLVATLFSVLAGLLIDRYGRKRVFSYSLLGVGLFSGFTSIITAFWQYILLRALVSVTEAGIRGSQTVLISEEAPPKQRGSYQGFGWLALYLGTGIGSVAAAGILDAGKWRLLFALTFLPMLLVLVTTRWLRESPRFTRLREDSPDGPGRLLRTGLRNAAQEIERDALRRLFSRPFRRQTAAMMGFGLFCTSAGAFTLLVAPLYLVENRDYSESRASLFIGVMALFSLLGNLPAGWLSDRISPKHVMVIWEALGTLLVIPLVVPGVGDWAIYLAFAAMGFFVSTGVVSFSVYLTGAFTTAIRGTALSMVLVSASLGGIIIPLISAPLVDLDVSYAVPLLILSFPLGALVSAMALRPVTPGVDIDRQAEEISRGS